MRVLLDDIAWNVNPGVDITHLPMLDIIHIEECYDQDIFWDACFKALEDKYGFEPFGCSYYILEGTIH